METAADEGGDRRKDEASRSKKSYRDSVLGDRKQKKVETFFDLDMGEVSDDDIIEESMDGSWFGIGMTREQKIQARRLWRNSLIMKLVGRSISYHYLLRRIQTMWRTQDDPLIIDLGNDYYIVSY